jgi:hypothetical protein
MTLFRVRQYGQTDWTRITISSEEDSELEQELGDKVRDLLDIPGLHVQEMGESGEWEDVE